MIILKVTNAPALQFLPYFYFCALCLLNVVVDGRLTGDDSDGDDRLCQNDFMEDDRLDSDDDVPDTKSNNRKTGMGQSNTCTCIRID